MLLCVGEMLPYRSESFHGVGLAPDLVREQAEKTAKLTQDSQYLAAVAMLRGDRQDGSETAQEAQP